MSCRVRGLRIRGLNISVLGSAWMQRQNLCCLLVQACSWVQKMSGGADFDVEQETKGLPEDESAAVRPAR